MADRDLATYLSMHSERRRVERRTAAFDSVINLLSDLRANLLPPGGGTPTLKVEEFGGKATFVYDPYKVPANLAADTGNLCDAPPAEKVENLMAGAWVDLADVVMTMASYLSGLHVQWRAGDTMYFMASPPAAPVTRLAGPPAYAAFGVPEPSPANPAGVPPRQAALLTYGRPLAGQAAPASCTKDAKTSPPARNGRASRRGETGRRAWQRTSGTIARGAGQAPPPASASQPAATPQAAPLCDNALRDGLPQEWTVSRRPGNLSILAD